MVGVGADGVEIYAESWYVRQPDAVLDDPRAESAFRLTGIDPDVVRQEGLSVTESQARLLAGLLKATELGVEVVRAFNQNFDFRMLTRNGFDLDASSLPRGECIMLAAMDLMGPLGVLPPAAEWVRRNNPDQLWKWPRLTEVVAFLNGKGHEIRWSETSDTTAPSLTPASRPLLPMRWTSKLAALSRSRFRCDWPHFCRLRRGSLCHRTGRPL